MTSAEMPSARELLQEGIWRLEQDACPSPRAEAEWLLSHLLGMKPLDLYLEDRDVSGHTTRQFLECLAARIRGAPLQYLLGESEFYGQPFMVAPGVFIPRPETEAVVEAALCVLRQMAARTTRPLRLLELGVGSGCIAVTLARQLSACAVVGVELSWEALRIAQANVGRYGLGSRVRLIQGSWMQPLRGVFDAIISNPPYIPRTQVDRLPLDVRQEPRLALDGGEDGVEALHELLACAPAHLAPGGLVVVECGETQAAFKIFGGRYAGKGPGTFNKENPTVVIDEWR